MNNIEVIKIEMGHADPAMYEQIDALIEGELVEWSIDYFQELSLNTSNRIERRRFISVLEVYCMQSIITVNLSDFFLISDRLSFSIEGAVLYATLLDFRNSFNKVGFTARLPTKFPP